MTMIDPLKFAAEFWPDVTFYREQQEIIYSVSNNVETFVPAGNMLGKDFVAAFICLWFFMSRTPCKIVATSVKEKHLKVLWGEIDKFIRTSKYPLEHSRGGPLICNQQTIQKVVKGRVDVGSYIMQLVANDQSAESFQGHHATASGGLIDDIPRTLFICDEASGVPDAYYKMAKTWAKRVYVFGNTWPCNNFFYRAIMGNPETKDPGGDLELPREVLSS